MSNNKEELNDLFKRHGKFFIADMDVFGNPDKVLKLLEGMLVIRAEHLVTERLIAYVAFCDAFEITDSKEDSPVYDIKVDAENVRHIARSQNE